MGDEGDRLNQQKKMMKWDRKKKRFVRETGKEDQKKKIKTDSGQVISNKKNRKNFYEEWKKNTRLMIQDLDQTEKQAEEAGSQQEVVAVADEVQTYRAPVTTKHARS
ncbi:ATP-dependent RNA helicase DDX54-like [Oreochromis aureus]|nr:ATP-dependent RNA helicase DDX54-like [Oreochromis aureus]